MTSLQLGLFAAGAVLVAGVLVYNWLQERRVRRRIREAFSPGGDRADRALEAGTFDLDGPAHRAFASAIARGRRRSGESATR